MLDAYLFESLDQVREISADWLRSYNEEQPYEALGCLSPAIYPAHLEAKTFLLKCLVDREAYNTSYNKVLDLQNRNSYMYCFGYPYNCYKGNGALRGPKR